jgi:hypothetical protein
LDCRDDEDSSLVDDGAVVAVPNVLAGEDDGIDSVDILVVVLVATRFAALARNLRLA